MKRVLIAAALALVLTSSCAAQSQPDHTMEKLLSAREALIKRYVLSEHLAVRVAICGETDLLNGEEHSYLTVYLHKDSVDAFFLDFANFATETTPGGSLGVQGIPVSVVVIDFATPKKGEPKPKEKPDNRTDFPTRKA
jgi:opacity protein-like surface antigen